MHYRIKSVVKGRGLKGAKVHVQQYANGPDKHGIYQFWCGQSTHKENVEVVQDEVSCGQCLRLLHRRAQLQSVRMAR